MVAVFIGFEDRYDDSIVGTDISPRRGLQVG